MPLGNAWAKKKPVQVLFEGQVSLGMSDDQKYQETRAYHYPKDKWGLEKQGLNNPKPSRALQSSSFTIFSLKKNN